MASKHRSLSALLAVGTALLVLACGPDPQILITAPYHGATSPPAAVTGVVLGINPAQVYVEVNGLPAALLPDGTWSIPWLAIEPGFASELVFHPVLADLRRGSDDALLARSRVVVHNLSEFGATVWPADVRVDEAVRGHLNRSGFPDLSTLVSAFLTREVNGALDEMAAASTLFDPDAPEVDVVLPASICVSLTPDLVPDVLGVELLGTPGDLCVDRVTADLFVARIPNEISTIVLPTTDRLIIDVGIDDFRVEGSLTLHGSVVVFDVLGQGVSVPLSDFEVELCPVVAIGEDVMGTTTVSLEPDAQDSHRIDAEQVSPVFLLAGGSRFELDGVCDLLGLNAIMTTVNPLLTLAARELGEVILNTPGLDGETPTSRSLEAQLEKQEIPLSTVVDPETGDTFTLDPPLRSISERPAGTTFATELHVTPDATHPDAPVQEWSFLVPTTPPTYAATTNSGQPYEFVAAITTGAINQALRSATELGTFNVVEPDVRIDFASMGICIPDPTVPVGCLSGLRDLIDVLVAFGTPSTLLPSNPLELRLTPTLPPVVTTRDSTALDPSKLHLHAGHYLIEIVEPLPSGDEKRWLQGVGDVRVPVSALAGAVPGTVEVGLNLPNASIGGAILEQSLSPTFPPDIVMLGLAQWALEAQLVPKVVGTIEAMPVPGIDDLLTAPAPGLEMVPVEMDVIGEYLNLFADLEPLP